MKKRPSEKEYAEYYAKYIDQVIGDDIMETLAEHTTENLAFINDIAEEKWDFRYAEGKWSIKELYIHIIDTERIMAYRALRIARNDKTPLAGYEQDDYVPYSDAEQRTKASIIAEYEVVRQASIQLFKNFTPEMWERSGTASGWPTSVLAVAYIIVGHEKHHVRVLKERYLNS
ncbi:MAG: DinB family protein [Chitinophagales bacterium]